MSDRLKEREKQVARARAELDLNLEALQSRLTLKSLADEAVGALRRSRYSDVIDDGFAAFRHNPVPTLIVGAAVALLAFQVRNERARRIKWRNVRRHRNAAASPTPGNIEAVRKSPQEGDLGGVRESRRSRERRSERAESLVN